MAMIDFTHKGQTIQVPVMTASALSKLKGERLDVAFRKIAAFGPHKEATPTGGGAEQGMQTTFDKKPPPSQRKPKPAVEPRPDVEPPKEEKKSERKSSSRKKEKF